jgi:hypothetical protein
VAVARTRNESAEETSRRMDEEVSAFRAKWEDSDVSAQVSLLLCFNSYSSTHLSSPTSFQPLPFTQAIKQTVTSLRTEIAAGATRESALTEQIRAAEEEQLRRTREREGAARERAEAAQMQRQQREEAVQLERRQKEEAVRLQREEAEGQTERCDSLKQVENEKRR